MYIISRKYGNNVKSCGIFKKTKNKNQFVCFKLLIAKNIITSLITLLIYYTLIILQFYNSPKKLNKMKEILFLIFI